MARILIMEITIYDDTDAPDDSIVHEVASLEFVESAAIMVNTIPNHPMGWQRFEVDENTRQER